VPYREEPEPTPDAEFVARAKDESAYHNMRAWRRALVTLTAIASLWPYLHLSRFSFLHITFALVAAVSLVEEWRLRRVLRKYESPRRP
jgi:hypothetical protein